jgi:hypothetical protein
MMTNKAGMTGNRIVEGGKLAVEAVSGRSFCAKHGIDHIHFLKIDAEGHDIEVLKGFDLDKVDFCQVEAMMNPHDRDWTLYEDLYPFMVSHGFYLFKFYNPQWEFKRGLKSRTVTLDGALQILGHGAPVMRVMDPVFINGRLAGVEESYRSDLSNPS